MAEEGRAGLAANLEKTAASLAQKSLLYDLELMHGRWPPRRSRQSIRRVQEAIDTYRVAADLREELGHLPEAKVNRIAANQLVVTAWAQKQWPNVTEITLHNVYRSTRDHAVLGGRPASEKIFRIFPLLSSSVPTFDVTVRIGPRGVVEVLHGVAEGRSVGGRAWTARQAAQAVGGPQGKRKKNVSGPQGKRKKKVASDWR